MRANAFRSFATHLVRARCAPFGRIAKPLAIDKVARSAARTTLMVLLLLCEEKQFLWFDVSPLDCGSTWLSAWRQFFLRVYVRIKLDERAREEQ